MRWRSGRERSTHGCENTKNIQFYNCNKFGHYTSYYWHKDNEQANVVEATNDAGSDTTLLLAHYDTS